MSGEPARIVEGFQAAALGLSDWTDALGTLADAMGAPKAQLIGWGADEALVVNLSHGIDAELMARFVAEGGGLSSVNPRIGLGLGHAADRFGTDAVLLDPAARDRWPIYRRLFDPFDAGCAAQTALSAPPGLVLGLSILRPKARVYADSELSFADAAAPGIAAAVGAALALGTQTASLAVTTAEGLGAAVILLGAEREVVSLSPAAERELRAGGILSLRAGRVFARGVANDRRLGVMIAGAIASEGRRGTAVLRDATGGGVQVEVLPLGRATSGPLSLARALLTIRTATGAPLPADGGDRLAERFGLTAAESAIATQLAHGRTLRQIADDRGRSYDTIRAQLRTLFDKTGRRRQADLIALVRGFD